MNYPLFFLPFVVWFLFSLNILAQPMVVAHRGNSSVAPENTMAAVKSALALQPQPHWIEIDLHQSKDGVLVVCHDANTQRTTGTAAWIRSTPYNQLRTLDAGYAERFGDQFYGEYLPRLEEVLDAVKNSRVNVMIECKQLLLEDDVIRLLRKRGELNRHIIASFDEITCYRAKDIEPGVKTLYLVSEINQVTMGRADDVQADIIGANQKTPLESVESAHAKGYGVWVWTVDNKNEIKQWIDAGVEAIITNRPETALKLTNSVVQNKD